MKYRKTIVVFLLCLTVFNGCVVTSPISSATAVFPRTWSVEDDKADISEVYISPNGEIVVSNKDFSYVELHFEETVTPQAFYVVIVKVDSSRSRFTNEEFPTVKLIGDVAVDYNGNAIKTEAQKNETMDDDSYLSVQRVFKSSKDGVVLFNIEIGDIINPMQGVVCIKEVVIIPIEFLEEYEVLESEDGTIRMVFYSRDIEESGVTKDTLSAWLNVYSDFRTHFKWLVGDLEPYEGHTDFVLTEKFPYYGLAGDPIYINREFVVNDLASIHIGNKPETSNIIWEYVHEMSHTFDGIGDSNINGKWNFDIEFFANLKMAYVLNSMGYGMDGEEKVIDYFSSYDTLNNRIYSSNGLVYSLISRVDSEELGEILRETFLTISNTSENLTTDQDKFKLFWERFNMAPDVDVNSLLSTNEKRTLYERFDYE